VIVIEGQAILPVAFYCAVDAAGPWISVLRPVPISAKAINKPQARSKYVRIDPL